MDRKLASIQKIIDIQPIPNADNIEVAAILGWKVVTRKGEFKPGDIVVYIEIDSVLPELPEFEFLRTNCFIDNGIVKGFRIKTRRLRKQISQGICFPISILSGFKYETDTREKPEYKFAEGDDVTALLKIEKYDTVIPISFKGEIKRNYPAFLCPKTDELRVQSFPMVTAEFNNLQCYISTKIDGTSVSFIHCDGEFDICSRNLSFIENEENLYWKIFKKYDLENKLKSSGNFCLQGELAGPGIQKNPMRLKEVDVFFFNIYDINNKRYLDYNDFINTCKKLGLKTVPIINDNFIFFHTIEQLLELAKGNYPGTNTPREGIVIRPVTEKHSDILDGRLSIKVINNDYLLDNE
ncbi:MAG: RNA ligase (ATP) [Candidatus Firestonebacteria bacterium]|nr:RNA ligase (ATP) [Candidatus Firestonebacteria bacterium]